MKFSGMSLPGSVTLMADNHKAVIDTTDGSVNITQGNNKVFRLENLIFKIPFVRGPAIIISIILSMLLSVWKKVIILSVILIAILVGLKRLFPSSTSTSTNTVTIYFDLGIWFLVTFYFIAFILSIRKNHAAEHKVIAAADQGDISFKNVKKQKKEHKRCGTTIGMWYMILYYALVPNSGWLGLLFTFSVAYEIAKLIKYPLIGTIIYAPSYLFQKIFSTKEPTDQRLEIVRQGMVKMLRRIKNDSTP